MLRTCNDNGVSLDTLEHFEKASRVGELYSGQLNFLC